MPSNRKIPVRENWRKRGRPSPVLEAQPEDLRLVSSRVMEQNAETNGCEDGPISLAVTNHNEVNQLSSKADMQMAKSISTQDGKKPKQASTNAKGNRPRRSAPSATNSAPAISPQSDRRATRNLASPAQSAPTSVKPISRTLTAAERKSVKNYVPIPATNTQSNKKVTQPPTLSPQVSGTASSTVGATPSSQDIPTPTATTNSRSTKHVQQSPIHSSPPLLKSQKRQLKRHSEIPTVELDSESSRASKRVRLQHQPFQSPPPPSIIPAILRQPVIKLPEDKIVVFNKGEFLAVRNENGSFFVCRTAQNVYKSSKRFKIQWMSDKETDIYIPDFYDQTDFECVLTNLRMKRVDKNKFMLPSEERQRTLNILQRALNVENGMTISPMQVTTDGVDVSIVGKEDEEILRLQQENLKIEQQTKVSPIRNRGRPKKPEPPAKLPATRSAISADKGITKALASRVKLRARETVKVKIKKEGGRRIIVTNKGGKPVSKLKKIAERLHPNPKVTVFEKDPTFQTNNILELIPLAESIIKLNSVCMVCYEEASYTKRIGNETELEIIGGTDKYMAVCRKCFQDGPLETTKLEEAKTQAVLVSDMDSEKENILARFTIKC